MAYSANIRGVLILPSISPGIAQGNGSSVGSLFTGPAGMWNYSVTNGSHCLGWSQLV